MQMWDRQKGETARAYGYFQVYRDLGRDRSLDRVLEAMKGDGGSGNGRQMSSRQVDRYSSKYQWVDRCHAYDTHLDGMRRKRTERERLEMADRQVSVARAFSNLVVKKLAEWATLVPNLSPAEAARIYESTAKIERLALGEPTEIGKHEVTARVNESEKFENMTSAERRAEMVATLKEMGKNDDEAEKLASELLPPPKELLP